MFERTDDIKKLTEIVLDGWKLINNTINIVTRLHSTIEQQQEVIIDLSKIITSLEKRISNIESKLNINI